MGLKVRIPSIQSIITLAITLLVLMFLIKVLPLPENFKNLFRI